MPNDITENEDWLYGLCNFTGYESGFPLGIIAPVGFGIITDYVKAGITQYSLTKDLPNGLIVVDEDMVKMADSLSPASANFPSGGIRTITANGQQLTRQQFIDEYKRDPYLVLGWMRKHPGLWTPKGRVNPDGSIAGIPPEDAIKIGDTGIHTPTQTNNPSGKPAEIGGSTGIHTPSQRLKPK